MSRENIRETVANLVAGLVTQYTTDTGKQLIVEYDNRIVVDTTTQEEPFLCVAVEFKDAIQPELTKRIHRFIGFIRVSVASKVGDGTAKSNQILDYFYPKIHGKDHDKVRCLMADVMPDRPHLGWVYQTMAIPFWSDQPNV